MTINNDLIKSIAFKIMDKVVNEEPFKINSILREYSDNLEEIYENEINTAGFKKSVKNNIEGLDDVNATAQITVMVQKAVNSMIERYNRPETENTRYNPVKLTDEQKKQSKELLKELKNNVVKLSYVDSQHDEQTIFATKLESLYREVHKTNNKSRFEYNLKLVKNNRATHFDVCDIENGHLHRFTIKDVKSMEVLKSDSEQVKNLLNDLKNDSNEMVIDETSKYKENINVNGNVVTFTLFPKLRKDTKELKYVISFKNSSPIKIESFKMYAKQDKHFFPFEETEKSIKSLLRNLNKMKPKDSTSFDTKEELFTLYNNMEKYVSIFESEGYSTNMISQLANSIVDLDMPELFDEYFVQVSTSKVKLVPKDSNLRPITIKHVLDKVSVQYQHEQVSNLNQDELKSYLKNCISDSKITYSSRDILNILVNSETNILRNTIRMFYIQLKSYKQFLIEFIEYMKNNEDKLLKLEVVNGEIEESLVKKMILNDKHIQELIVKYAERDNKYINLGIYNKAREFIARFDEVLENFKNEGNVIEDELNVDDFLYNYQIQEIFVNNIFSPQLPVTLNSELFKLLNKTLMKYKTKENKHNLKQFNEIKSEQELRLRIFADVLEFIMEDRETYTKADRDTFKRLVTYVKKEHTDNDSVLKLDKIDEMKFLILLKDDNIIYYIHPRFIIQDMGNKVIYSKYKNHILSTGTETARLEKDSIHLPYIKKIVALINSKEKRQPIPPQFTKSDYARIERMKEITKPEVREKHGIGDIKYKFNMDKERSHLMFVVPNRKDNSVIQFRLSPHSFVNVSQNTVIHEMKRGESAFASFYNSVSKNESLRAIPEMKEIVKIANICFDLRKRI